MRTIPHRLFPPPPPIHVTAPEAGLLTPGNNMKANVFVVAIRWTVLSIQRT